MGNIQIVEKQDKDEFKKACDELLKRGYQLSSSSCGFVNSGEYNFCNVYQAVFISKFYKTE
jgi:hypothetical protein